MPLAAGNDPQTISRNISELTHHGNQPRSHAQIIAIALSNADRHPHRASGGGIGFHPVSYHLMSAPKGMGSVASHVERPMNPSQGTPYWTRESLRDMGRSGIGRFAMGGAPASEMVPPTERASMRIMDQPFHGGLISSPVGGRTDRLPLNVPSDSHVIPADIMSGLNQGNSFGSDHLLNQVLGGGTGPYGVPDPKMIHGKGPPPAPHIDRSQMDLARGGISRTPILAAGGEFVVPPWQVEALGQRGLYQGRGKSGESAMACGHRLLDEMIAKVRQFIVHTTKRLPPPKK